MVKKDIVFQALRDNKATTFVSGPAREVTVSVVDEETGYKILIVTIDGKERVRVTHIHPRLLHLPKGSRP
jgi:hypothetical protein